MDVTPDQLSQRILALARARGPNKTICPSEVARDLAGSNEKAWRLLMRPIRAQAVKLARAGAIELRRKGKPVNVDDFKGIYRIAWTEKETP